MNAAAPSLLVVDDDADTCSNLSDIFTDLGYHVDTAQDGPAALAKVRDARYDVAVLDLMMPGMDGVAVYDEIKRLRPEVVAILATAYPNHPRAEQSLDAGMWRIVPKPLELSALMALFDKALNEPLVLVVDDDPGLCASLWDILREEGFRVGIAHSVRIATQRLRDTGFQVVLIDMRLPDGDGAAVFREVRQANPEARTILITGHRNEVAAHVNCLRQHGADAVCLKPFDVGELIATVKRLSGR